MSNALGILRFREVMKIVMRSEIKVEMHGMNYPCYEAIAHLLGDWLPGRSPREGAVLLSLILKQNHPFRSMFIYLEGEVSSILGNARFTPVAFGMALSQLRELYLVDSSTYQRVPEYLHITLNTHHLLTSLLVRDYGNYYDD